MLIGCMQQFEGMGIGLEGMLQQLNGLGYIILNLLVNIISAIGSLILLIGFSFSFLI